jgi:hypothetical protein
LKAMIEDSLHVLIGMPLWNAGRSADVEWFDFGSRLTTIPKRKGGTVLVGEYVIDTECAWHIGGPNGIVVASRDRLYPAGIDPHKDLLEFEWDKPGANRCDERMQSFLDEHKSFPLIVGSLEANNLGGLKLDLSGGYTLEIFPDNSLDSEYWRFFEPHSAKKHFVVTAQGIR